jgi:hypothetical protein
MSVGEGVIFTTAIAAWVEAAQSLVNAFSY